MSKLLSGKKISKRQAYKGLGDPSTWEKEKEVLMKEFRARPKKSKKDT